MQYGSLDAGHLVLAGPGGDLGGYVGYRYFYERENAFGFVQLAHPEPTTPTSILGITETEAYSGLAVGVNARLNLAERWQLQMDAALLPDVRMWGTDNHWFRADINPGPERGFGWGTQFEAILTYALTDQWTIGAGARYWYFIAPSSIAQFPRSATNSPITFSSERYGGFLQASYKFGAPATPSGLQAGPGASRMDRDLHWRQLRCRVRAHQLVRPVRADLDRRPGSSGGRACGRPDRR